MSPNPNNGTFILNYPINETAQVFVYNLLGTLIYSGDISHQNQVIQLINVRPGVYMVYLDLSTTIINTKILM